MRRAALLALGSVGILIISGAVTYLVLSWLHSTDHPRWQQRVSVCEREGPPSQHGFETYNARENACLEITKGLARRDGQTLLLRLLDDRELSLADRRDQFGADNDEGFAYTLIDYIPRANAFLIYNQGYESGEFILVDQANGQQIDLPELPDFSPSQTRLVSVMADHPYNWVGLKIVGLNPLRIEFEESGGSFHFVRWDGDDRIRLVLSMQPDGETGARDFDAEAVREASDWVLRHMPETKRPAKCDPGIVCEHRDQHVGWVERKRNPSIVVGRD